MAKKKAGAPASAATAQAARGKAARDRRTMTVNYIIISVFALAVAAIVLYTRGAYLPYVTALETADEKMNAVTFNYFYRDCYDSFQSAYGEMLDAYGTIDHDKTLDEQNYSAELTWAQFFYDTARQNAARTMVIHEAAVRAGETLSEEGEAEVGRQIEALRAGAKRNGYVSVGKYLRSHYGKGATLASYRDYLTYEALATEYSTSYYGQTEYSEEELAVWFEENYPDAGDSYDYNTVDFRLIYFPFSGYAYDSDSGSYGYSDAARESARSQLQVVLDLYNNGEKTEEAFAALAEQYSAYKSAEGGLYENAVKDDSGTEAKVLQWVFSASRKTGDMETIEADSGDYMLYWVGEDIPAWQYLAQKGLDDEGWSTWYEAQADAVSIEENPKLLSYLYLAA